MKHLLKSLLVLTLGFIFVACDTTLESPSVSNTPIPTAYINNKIIDVESCNLSGDRQANVKVDIGYGPREYYAYTNEQAQLVYVQANEIILQSDDELAEGKKRYCNDEAKVPGTESKTLDEGHVIADSLGGVGNAYNITPQASQLNRYGEQAKMERLMRDTLNSGGTVTDFTAEISYPDGDTQIPDSYVIQMRINNEQITFEFFNTDN